MNGSGHSSPHPGSITPPTWLNGLLIGQTVMPCPSCLSEDIWKVLLRPRDSLRHHGLQQLWLLYPQLSLRVCLMSNELVKLSNHLILASPFSICLIPSQNQGLFQGGMWPIQAWFWFQIEPFPALGLPLLSSASSPALEFLFHFKMVQVEIWGWPGPDLPVRWSDVLQGSRVWCKALWLHTEPCFLLRNADT